MLQADGNSGVKYLVQKVDEWVNKEGRQARARGLEYQLADDRNADAASDASRVAGSLYSVIAPVPKVAPKIGEFNHSRLVVQGGVVEHWLNGTRVVRYETRLAGSAKAPPRTARPRGRDSPRRAAQSAESLIGDLVPESEGAGKVVYSTA